MFGWKKKQKPAENESAVAVQEKSAAVTAPVEPSDQEQNGGLKVKVKERKGCSVLMSIEVHEDHVADAMEESYRRVQGKAKFPGFRPGKAPMELVMKNFEGVAWEDAVDHLLKETIYDALTQEKIIGVGAPVVDKLEGHPGTALRYELKIECAPHVQLKEYKGLAIVRHAHPVADADEEKRLHELKENHAKLVLSKDTILDKKHFAVVDYESFLEGQPINEQDIAWLNKVLESAKAERFPAFNPGAW